MKLLITDAAVKALEPQDKPYEVRDEKAPGFLLRVQPSGVMTFYVEYRKPATDKQGWRRDRVKLGGYPVLNVPKARKKAEAMLAEIKLGADPAATRRDAIQADDDVMTLERFIHEVWSPTYRVTRKAHDPQLKRLLSGFKPLLDIPLANLTREHFEKHRQDRMKVSITKKGEGKIPSATTLNRCNATMRPVLEMARKRGLIATNPLADVAKAKEDKNMAIRAMTAEEEKAIEGVFTTRREARLAEVAEINARRATEGRRPIPAVPVFLDYLQPMFRLSVETGIRRGEAFSLEWSDIDLQGAKLTVRGEVAKSSQSRTIPLTTRAVAVMTDWKAQGTGEGLVFPSRIGGDRLKNIDGGWRELCKDAKVTGLRWHDLRHTFGSRAALAGVPMVVLKALMGHSVITTTMRYAHSTEADARAAIMLLENPKKEVTESA